MGDAMPGQVILAYIRKVDEGAIVSKPASRSLLQFWLLGSCLDFS